MDYLTQLVQYIHFNPVESNLCIQPFEWQHSSYNQLVSREETFLKRDEALEWFENKKNFISMHSIYSDKKKQARDRNKPSRF